MNDLQLILSIIGVGIYSVIGLHFYAILSSQTRSNGVRLLLFPLFIILFIAGGFIACRMLEIFHVADKIKPSSQNVDFFMTLLWAGIIAIYIALSRHTLKRRFNISFTLGEPRFASDAHTRTSSHLGHISELDGLRGLAIILVLIFHGTTCLPGGFIGVDIFFVLSGFLITTLLVQEFDGSKTINMCKFYIRRALRLGPALIAMLIVFCTLSFSLTDVTGGWYSCLEALIALLYMSNWARAFYIYPPAHLGFTWSLSIEEQFYILWPVLLLILLRVMKKRHHIIMVAAGLTLMACLLRIGLCLHGASTERLYNGLDTRADSLMIGCTLGLILTSGLITGKIKHSLQQILKLLAPLSALCLIEFIICVSWRDPMVYYYGLVIVELLTAILILDLCINPGSWLKSFLGMKWLVWIGTISYGLYLWHGLIYGIIEGLGLGTGAFFLIGTFLTFLSAALSYYALEKPIRALKRFYTS